MYILANSGGWAELIILLTLIVLQLFASMAKQKNKGQPSKDMAEKQTVSAPPKRNVASETWSEWKNESDADEIDLDSLWEALGMERPRATEQDERAKPAPAQPMPAQTTNSSAPPPRPSVETNVPSPAASQAPTSSPRPMSEKKTVIKESKPVIPVLQVEVEQKKLESEVNAALQNAMKISGELSKRESLGTAQRRIDLKKLLQDRDEIQKAIVLSEILGRPAGLK